MIRSNARDSWREGQIVELSPEEATAELEANLAKRESKIPSSIK